MVRWMQAGSYTPFFRGHAHHDAKRREPWMFGEPTTTQIRSVVMARYALLPYWYTLFYEASVSGAPTMRPLWFEYPADADTFSMDDQWLVGADVLVKPVTSPGVSTTEVYLPGAEPWYDVDTYEAFTGPKRVTMPTPLEKIAALQRGGSIVPRKMRLRRSSKLMVNDPYTLFVALDTEGRAKGHLYMDDEHSLSHKEGSFTLRRFCFEGGVLEGSAPPGTAAGFEAGNTVERVVVIGMATAPTKITATVAGQSRDLTFDFDSFKKVLTIRKPDVVVSMDFAIAIVT